jgi:hypothetical protein
LQCAPSRLFGDRFRRHNRYRHITMVWIWPTFTV